MSIDAAIRAVARKKVAGEVISAWRTAEPFLREWGITNNKRRAMLIGQCAHESGQFAARYENLNYSSSALWVVFKKHFKNAAETERFARKPELIANRVYSNRMGNGDESTGEGYLYRGRGYLQLTGKSNYNKFGKLLGIDLLNEPDQVAEPVVSLQVAALYCASRKRNGKTLLEWADEDDVRMVTRGINGGTHGLADRINKTEAALSALGKKVTTAEKQRLLVANGFDPGPIDGLPGPKTTSATALAKKQFGISPPELWQALARKAN